jgi:LacI family transcriptional regulator
MGQSGRRATITDVAALARVSIKTVSRVVNGVTTVDAELAHRVREAIAQLNYRPNHLASTLKSGAPTSFVGYIGKRLSGEREALILFGAETVVRRHAGHLITASSSESGTSDEDMALAGDLIKRRVDGLLIVPAGGDFSGLQKDREMGIPTVFLDRVPDGVAADSVITDNEGGSERALEHLIADGHERIALLMGSTSIESVRRCLRGARRAMKRAGILLSQSPLMVGITDRASAADAMAQLADSANPPTAVFCENEEITVGVIDEVVRRGVDVAVAGFGVFRLAELMPLPLVLVRTDPYEVGRAGADLLYWRLDHPDRPVEQRVVPVDIVSFPGTR